MVQNWETKPVHSAQCRHVVVCTHQIRRKRTWESLLKTIFDWESQPYQVSKINPTLSKLPIKLHLLVCQVCCCAGARIIMLFFFTVCRAPNRAPMRAFSRCLSCTKSSSTLWFLVWCICWEIVAGGFSVMFAIFSLSWRYRLLVVVLTKLEDCYLYFELISSCTK